MNVFQSIHRMIRKNIYDSVKNTVPSVVNLPIHRHTPNYFLFIKSHRILLSHSAWIHGLYIKNTIKDPRPF